MTIQASASSRLTAPYLNGLKVSWASNTTLTVATGSCNDSTNSFDISVGSTLTINAAVNGINGLDTGTFAASTVYYIYLIADYINVNVTAAIISLSASAPLLPTGYEIYRRIGWAVSDGSTHFVKMYQSGSGLNRLYSFDEPVSIISTGTSATFLAVDLTTFVPAFNNLPLNIQMAFTPNAANDAANVRGGGSSATNGCVITGPTAAKIATGQVFVDALLVTGAPKIEYKVTASGNLDAALVSVADSL